MVFFSYFEVADLIQIIKCWIFSHNDCNCQFWKFLRANIDAKILLLTLVYMQRSRPLSGYTIPSSQALSRLRKDLREAHLQLLLGNGVYRSSNTTLNAAADSFLSSFALDFPTSEAEKHSRSSISAGDDMCSNNESALPTWNLRYWLNFTCLWHLYSLICSF